MRPLVIGLAAIGMSGCTTAASGPPWQKQGADEQTNTTDTSTCHDVARAEAGQRYPYQIGSPAPFGVPSAQQSDALSRSTFEAERFEACMQGRGYSRR
jgi:hypothetical protein